MLLKCNNDGFKTADFLQCIVALQECKNFTNSA